MPIKHTITVDNNLEKALGEVLKNPRNNFDIQGVLTLSHEVSPKGSITAFGPTGNDKIPVVDLYLNDKYAEFHDEFTQTASINPELKPLMDYLSSNGWDTNLD